MTADRFCTLLAEYWGFSGYTLGETIDETYFDEPITPVEASSLLKDMPTDTAVNYYLTVFFDGDQEGAPVYIYLQQYPGYVMLSVGVTHSDVHRPAESLIKKRQLSALKGLTV